MKHTTFFSFLKLAATRKPLVKAFLMPLNMKDISTFAFPNEADFLPTDGFGV